MAIASRRPGPAASEPHPREPDGREPDGREPDGREPDGREPDAPGPGRAAGRAGRLRPALAGLMLALAGGAAAVALGLWVGALHTSPAATTVVRAAPVAPAPSTPRATWAAVYAAANAGAVDITAQHTTIVPGPLGDRTRHETAIGSGVVLDGRGDILTAEHVVGGAAVIRVRFSDATARSARLVGRDVSSDIAVVRVDPAGLTLHPPALGSSAALTAGAPVAVLGDPLGFDRSLSTGVVSALHRTIQAPNGYQIVHAFQTDAAMNPGNSGGPLLNTRAQVVGIADQIATGTDRLGDPGGSHTSTGVGFAVPIDLIKAELPALEHGRMPAHAYLGVVFTSTASGATGAVIARVRPRTPAARAGLRHGDVILAVDGTAITSERDLAAALATRRPGQRTELRVRRGRELLTVPVVLGVRPA